MKVLWIVNSVLSDLGQVLYGKPTNGVWMDALLADFKGRKGLEIVVATTAKRKDVFKFVSGNVVYYVLPDKPPILYNENKKRNVKAWRNLIQTEKPDVIQVWGTEFTHGLCALRVAKDIPSVVVIQGLLCEIAQYYVAGMSFTNFYKTVTIRDLLKRDSMRQQQKKYLKSAEKEAEIIRLAKNVIGENDWCFSAVKRIYPYANLFNCKMSIDNVFDRYKWDIDKIQRHSIMCNASGYTIKGLHILLNAIALLKKKYPDMKLYIPGDPVVSDGSVKGFLKKRGYAKYIEKLIKNLNISGNIVWLGRISHEQLAKEYSCKHVFVMPSAIENQSSSLIEAMTVGVPCVVSNVGGVTDYVVHQKNGFLYRFENYSLLAYYIDTIFSNDSIACKISSNAQSDLSLRNNQCKITEKMIHIYDKLAESI